MVDRALVFAAAVCDRVNGSCADGCAHHITHHPYDASKCKRKRDEIACQRHLLFLNGGWGNDRDHWLDGVGFAADKRGSWAYHSVDGWYLNTSPEHYRVHKCYIKSTNSGQLSDTDQFQHKSITNPSLTPANKLMNAIANCRKAIKGIVFNF
jgi:hypothetical protein